jgi:hypothetical protein
MPRDTKSIFEADCCSLIEPEQIARIFVEAALAEIAVEPVSQLKARSVEREPQRRRKVQNAEIRLRQHQFRIVAFTRNVRLDRGLTSRRV